jgi:hypothetical protein
LTKLKKWGIGERFAWKLYVKTILFDKDKFQQWQDFCENTFHTAAFLWTVQITAINK